MSCFEGSHFDKRKEKGRSHQIDSPYIKFIPLFATFGMYYMSPLVWWPTYLLFGSM